ncbi:FxsA family protein [Listeria monocytogenes]|nr:membrane protein FxsA [Listeria monocytogenes]EKE9604036.1 membrane protein FxsA [Listeria monocytogenes]EKE9606897.1 membrane protein FxsA [Listeria monocytogenes]EKE9609756.1 membrane protein FxsA [Listeria monocytogenes]EMC6840201.1 membrane protein FxsA [Listeria monocytogenes]
MRKFILYWALYGLIELIMYVWLFQVIGFWSLLFIQIASSAFGVFIFKRLGGNLFRNLRDGRTVAPYLLDSLCFFIAGFLLIIPGVITTILGLLIFIPFSRKLLKPKLTKWLGNQKKHTQYYYFDM